MMLPVVRSLLRVASRRRLVTRFVIARQRTRSEGTPGSHCRKTYCRKRQLGQLKVVMSSIMLLNQGLLY